MLVTILAATPRNGSAVPPAGTIGGVATFEGLEAGDVAWVGSSADGGASGTPTASDPLDVATPCAPFTADNPFTADGTTEPK